MKSSSDIPRSLRACLCLGQIECLCIQQWRPLEYNLFNLQIIKLQIRVNRDVDRADKGLE